MRLFHKLLLTLTVFYISVIGSAAYFFFTNLNTILSETAVQATLSTAAQVKEAIAPVWSSEWEVRLRKYFLADSSRPGGIEDFVVLDSAANVVFGLNPESASHAAMLASQPNALESDGFRLYQQMPGQLSLTVSWSVADSFTAVMLVDGRNRVEPAIQKLTMQLYVVGFSGLVGIILLAMFLPRIIKKPMGKVAQAMDFIDKRKYGFRIESKIDDEFSGAYHKVNTALTRLEQLDSLQRTAIKKRNGLLDELKTLSRYLDIMAHEVKNPMHALVINIDVLRTKLKKAGIDDGVARHLDIIEREIDHLKEVIGGFLSYVRPGMPQKEKTNLNQLVKEVAELASSEAKSNGVEFETRFAKSLGDIQVDRGHLRQALHNVIINAIHASPQQGKIQVRTNLKGNRALISVRDQGDGVSAEDLVKIFDLYFTTKKNGSGIGLPLTRKLIEANGGKFDFDSRVDKGTTVTFSFKNA